MKNGNIWGKCQDGYGSHLQWKKSESRDRFRKLGVSVSKKFIVYSYDVQFILFLFLLCLSQSCIPLIQTDFKNRLNCLKCWFKHPLPYIKKKFDPIIMKACM